MGNCFFCCSPATQLELEIPEYGTCCPTFPSFYHPGSRGCRDVRGHACTPQRIVLPIVSLVAMVAIILHIASAAETVPWIVISTYNGTSAMSNTCVWRDTYAPNGDTSTTFCCPYSDLGKRGQRGCVSPSAYTPAPLTSFDSGVDVARAHASMQPLSSIATVLGAAAAGILAFGLCPTGFMPAPGYAGASVARLVASLAAVQVLSMVLQGSAMGVWDRDVFNPVKSNATLMAWTGSPGATSPSMQLQRGDGYFLTAATVAFAGGSVLIVAALAAVVPRWFWGTRAQYYRDVMAAHGVPSSMVPMAVPYGVAAPPPYGVALVVERGDPRYPHLMQQPAPPHYAAAAPMQPYAIYPGQPTMMAQGQAQMYPGQPQAVVQW